LTGIAPLSSSRVPRRLQDIIDNAQAIFEYTEGMDLTAFEEDRKTYDAVERSAIAENQGVRATSCGMNMTRSERTGFLKLSKPTSPVYMHRLWKRCAGGIYSSCHEKTGFARRFGSACGEAFSTAT
jgi:hypothetical protein